MPEVIVREGFGSYCGIRLKADKYGLQDCLFSDDLKFVDSFHLVEGNSVSVELVLNGNKVPAEFFYSRYKDGVVFHGTCAIKYSSARYESTAHHYFLCKPFRIDASWVKVLTALNQGKYSVTHCANSKKFALYIEEPRQMVALSIDVECNGFDVDEYLPGLL